MAKSPPVDDAAPFTPKLCTGCVFVDECSKLRLLREASPTELTLCGLYSPITPPASPDKE